MDVVAGTTAVVDLPATGEGAVATEVVSAPLRAALHTQGGTTWVSTPADAVDDDQVVFRATSGAGVSAPATVTLRYCRPPVISSAPGDAEVCAGSRADLEVGASGQWLSYEWSKDGEPVPGAHGMRLSIEEAEADDSGDYEVTVRAWCGRVQNPVTEAVSIEVVNDGPACTTAILLPALRNQG
jgi:hypothetical protein